MEKYRFITKSVCNDLEWVETTDGVKNRVKTQIG